jgi:hypothetical protein
MPVNHYRHTNFPTSQRGSMRVRYRIASSHSAHDRDTIVAQLMPQDALGWY